MIAENFDRTLRAFQRRTPFQPFTVELVSGTRIQVDHPEALVFRDGVAVFVCARRSAGDLRSRGCQPNARRANAAVHLTGNFELSAATDAVDIMSNAISSTLALPSFLHEREDGAIAIRGSRITLFAILEAKAELLRKNGDQAAIVAAITDEFPSVPAETIADVLEFCAQNSAPVGRYFAEETAIAERNAQEHPYTGPSLDELRRRREHR